MTNVIQLPNRVGRDWTVIAPALEEWLDSNGASAEAKQRVISAAREFWVFLDFDLNLMVPDVALGVGLTSAQAAATRAGIGAAISQALSQRLQPITTRLFTERVNREVAHCQKLGIF